MAAPNPYALVADQIGVSQLVLPVLLSDMSVKFLLPYLEDLRNHTSRGFHQRCDQTEQC